MSTTYARKHLATALVVLLLGALAAAPAFAAGNGYDRGNGKGNQLILRADQAEDVARLAAQYGVEVVSELTTDGYVALVEGPESMTAEQLMDLMRSDSRVKDMAPARLTALPSTDQARLATEEVTSDVSKIGDFTTPCVAEGFDRLLWSGFADQDAVRQIRLHEAQLRGDCGSSAIVAVLDTGVDPRHPLLEDALVSGYDFILDQPGLASEWSNLHSTFSAIVEEELRGHSASTFSAIVEGEGEPILMGASFGPVLGSTFSAIVEELESTFSAIVEEPRAPFFGHGTMVAGLVRLAAPGARIMPLRVFDGAGTAHSFDIIRAVYYAVDNGADVINMSFSMADFSPELLRAVQYARKNGVVCVSAAGNQSQHALVYPAAFGETVAVASTTDDDDISDFSNYGSGLVDLGAPGSGVVSIYPGGAFGVGWGTSFSAPLVAGTAALLLDHFPAERNGADVRALVNALRHGADPVRGLSSKIGRGRLNTLGAVLLVE